jgi:hypothetical protein
MVRVSSPSAGSSRVQPDEEEEKKSKKGDLPEWQAPDHT